MAAPITTMSSYGHQAAYASAPTTYGAPTYAPSMTMTGSPQYHHVQQAGPTYGAPTYAPSMTMTGSPQYAQPMMTMSQHQPAVTYGAPAAPMQVFDNASYNTHSAFTGLHDHHTHYDPNAALAAYGSAHMAGPTYGAPTYAPSMTMTGSPQYHHVQQEVQPMMTMSHHQPAVTYGAPAAPVGSISMAHHVAAPVQQFANPQYNVHSGFTGLHDHHTHYDPNAALAAYGAVHHQPAVTYAAPQQAVTYAAPALPAPMESFVMTQPQYTTNAFETGAYQFPAAQYGQPAMYQQAAYALDLNNDGQVTQAEMAAADTNHDGKLDKTEIAAAVKKSSKKKSSKKKKKGGCC